MLLPPPKQELLPPIPHGDGEPELWPCWRDSGFVNASVCAVFQPNQSPLITGTGVKPAKRSRSWNGGDAARAVPGAEHMQGCSDLALSILLPL